MMKNARRLPFFPRVEADTKLLMQRTKDQGDNATYTNLIYDGFYVNRLITWLQVRFLSGSSEKPLIDVERFLAHPADLKPPAC